jgi:hypothetical protein
MVQGMAVKVVVHFDWSYWCGGWWNDIRQSLSHVSSAVRSFWKMVVSPSDVMERKTKKPSANNFTGELTASGRLFIKARNRSRPMTFSWRTPELTSA